MSFRTRVGALLLLATALQLGTGSLAAQHIAVSLGENRQEVLQPSAQITLPVLVDMTNADALNLASLQLRVTWDTAVVGYTSWSAGTFGTIEVNEDAVAGGTFQANLLSTTGTTGSFTAMNLSFDASTAGSTVVALSILATGSESGGDLLSRSVANSVSICIDAGGILGDVTGGDAVDVIDAQQIARWLIDLAVTTSNRMRSHGDVNNDGQTNIVDAQQIARRAVELPVSYPISDAIVLDCADALTVSTTALPTTGVGTEYSQTLSAAGAGSTYSWAISAGTLPAGLTLVGATISGTPTAVGTSEFTAKVTSVDGQIATRPLSIKVLPELSVTTASLPVGIVDTAYATTLTATGGDSTFVWSITSGTLPDGLTLSADTISGTPTAAATSTFTVQVTTGDGQTATKELSISIHGTLSITTTSLSDGVVGSLYKDTLTATGGDGTYTWSVSAGTLPAGLTLNADTIAGTPTATDTSTVTLQATSGDAQTTTKELSITVTRVADTVELSPTSLSFSSVSDTASLTATVKDHAGVTMIGAPVTWASSDTTKATVSSAGLVTSVADGTATITATSGAASKTATVTVSQVASSMTLSPTSLSFASFADTTTMAATVKDANDSTIASPTVTWASSSPSVATVSSAGLVTAIANGTATITATSGSVSKTATATVTQVASSVTLSPTSLSLTSFAEIAWISATVRDANDSTIVSPTVTWTTSDTTKATVSSAGLVTAVANGTATITATSGSVSATASVTVTQGVSSVTLSPTSLSFASFADTTTMAATVKDANDSTIVSPTVTWTTSDTTKATVSSAGLVTSKGNGTATITATSGSVSATASVTVTQGVSSVTLSPTSLSFASFADTATITATVRDANDSTIASPTVTWASSSPSVATVSSAGLVTAVGNGTATITATSGSVTKTASVTVTQAAASITLSADSMDVLVSDTATITATVKDANDSTIASPTITWTTSSSSLATVSSAGLVTGVAAGTIQITATHAGLSDATTVTALVGKSGIISSNETWSTFIKLTDNFKVSDGVTLTIDAGTVIKVTEGADIQVLVEGTLLSQGTSGNEIVFRGASGSTEKGTWEGIKFRNTTHNAANQNGWVAGSKIEYTKVRNAETGIYTYSQGLYVNNSEFKYNLEAIELRKTDSVYIANSTFTDNNYGVWTEYQPSGETDSYGDFNDAWFNDNTFKSNQTGILIGPNQRSVNNFNFTDNRFENNSSYGIQFGQGGYGIRNSGGAVTFTSNDFVDNGTALGLDHYDGNSGWDLEITSNGFGRNTTALRLEGLKGDTDITSNFFYLNTTTLTSSTQNQDFTFNENIVYKDVDVFLFPANGYQSVQPSITENLIDANSGKILDIKGTISVLTFEQNVVTGSTFGSAWFYNETSNNFTFSSNFIDWGTSTEAAKVYDGNDDFDYGTITFSNALGSAAESTTGRSSSEYAALIAALALS